MQIENTSELLMVILDMIKDQETIIKNFMSVVASMQDHPDTSLIDSTLQLTGRDAEMFILGLRKAAELMQDLRLPISVQTLSQEELESVSQPLRYS